ncbi:neuroligin-4, X-linked-like [Uloborus diversus]|uniref:neuroligin-4, X-linked-like n=1 Tax=Uloborus diversus TaxID=327109 RepID=UPI002409D6E9|nr:neuroligin-4, X-linked-like [Uloborus diversus]
MKVYFVVRVLRLIFLVGVVTLSMRYGIVGADTSTEEPLAIVGEHLRSQNKPRTRIVNTKYGELRGFITTLPNRQLQTVEVFLGVPYASPPISALRFMPPVTPAHWKGVRTTDRFSPVCPQRPPDISNETEALKRMPPGRLEYLKKLLPYLRNQSEDCLYLNIYAPSRRLS